MDSYRWIVTVAHRLFDTHLVSHILTLTTLIHSSLPRGFVQYWVSEGERRKQTSTLCASTHDGLNCTLCQVNPDGLRRIPSLLLLIRVAIHIKAQIDHATEVLF